MQINHLSIKYNSQMNKLPLLLKIRVLIFVYHAIFR